FSLIYTASPALHTLSLHDALPIFERLIAVPRTRITVEHQSRVEADGVYVLRLHLQATVSHEVLLGNWSFYQPITSEPFARSRHLDRKSTRLNSSHVKISYAVFCLK